MEQCNKPEHVAVVVAQNRQVVVIEGNTLAVDSSFVVDEQAKIFGDLVGNSTADGLPPRAYYHHLHCFDNFLDAVQRN